MTTAWLLEVCGASNLDAVKSVNLWAKSLTNRDVSTVLCQCRNLEVASLSLNKISSLQPFNKLSCLKELFLRKNEVADISELVHLQVRGRSAAVDMFDAAHYSQSTGATNNRALVE